MDTEIAKSGSVMSFCVQSFAAFFISYYLSHFLGFHIYCGFFIFKQAVI